MRIVKNLSLCAARFMLVSAALAQTPAPWTGVKVTDKLAPACMQSPVVMPALGLDAYYFNHRPQYPNTPQFKDWGASHGSEISFVFGNFTSAMPANTTDKAVSDQMSSYWVNFAKTGNPNGTGLPNWPAFTDANQQVMEIDDPSKAIPVPNLDKLKDLDGYFAWRRSRESDKN